MSEALHDFDTKRTTQRPYSKFAPILNLVRDQGSRAKLVLTRIWFDVRWRSYVYCKKFNFSSCIQLYHNLLLSSVLIIKRNFERYWIENAMYILGKKIDFFISVSARVVKLIHNRIKAQWNWAKKISEY